MDDRTVRRGQRCLSYLRHAHRASDVEEDHDNGDEGTDYACGDLRSFDQQEDEADDQKEQQEHRYDRHHMCCRNRGHTLTP